MAPVCVICFSINASILITFSGYLEAKFLVSPISFSKSYNDEIVGYLLARPDGQSADALEFAADVRGVPRDAEVETLVITAVAATHESPPYTLYRLNVMPDSTKTTRSPVIDNVLSLRLTYFDGAGAVLDPPGGAEDPQARRVRGEIRRIRIELTGLTRDADPDWLDTEDPNPATRRHRKYRLTVDLSPRNLGLVGRPDEP